MELVSNSFANNSVIPAQYTCDGKDITPHLTWRDAPLNTKSFALIVEDPDAPAGLWVHWILYNIPPEVISLEENLASLPAGTEVGINSWQRKAYGGPCPPSGQHRYYFRLYALDEMLSLSGNVDRDVLYKAMSGHVLAKVELLGLYR